MPLGENTLPDFDTLQAQARLERLFGLLLDIDLARLEKRLGGEDGQKGLANSGYSPILPSGTRTGGGIG